MVIQVSLWTRAQRRRSVTVSFSSLQFNHAPTGCITVSFSVCSLPMLSQVLLQFLFQFAFDHAFTGSITVSFSVCSLTMLSQVVLQFFFSLLLIMHSQVA